MEYDSLESPLTSIHGLPTSFHDRWSASGKPCSYQGRVVDVSLKEGLFSASSNGHGICSTGESDWIDNIQDFTGFQQRSLTNSTGRSLSPQRPCSRVDLEDVCIFSTPRKLIHSLQEPSYIVSDISKKHHAQYGSPCFSTNKRSPLWKYDQNGSTVKPKGAEEGGSSYACNKQLWYDLVSKGCGASKDSVLPVPFALDGLGPPGGLCTKRFWNTNFIKACSVLFVFTAVLVSMLLIDEGGANDHLVPT